MPAKIEPWQHLRLGISTDWEIFLSFFESHQELVTGRLNTATGRETYKKLWKELSLQLNSARYGVKTTEKWQKNQISVDIEITVDYRLRVKSTRIETLESLACTGHTIAGSISFVESPGDRATAATDIKTFSYESSDIIFEGFISNNKRGIAKRVCHKSNVEEEANDSLLANEFSVEYIALMADSFGDTSLII
ncbi:hypothetical protein NQ315_000449 [Exocentrus adspersus]|uniref:Uncharacterized protein n=1 Tax=Exocentrus adspersus TaxID=1586481 RepID=A0AAV8V7F6_9CUCU|nr:hypothetical protein NQ315_000449 [Exocentrus adspersus]